MSSTSSQSLHKRAAPIQTSAFIAIIVSAVIAFNIVILLAWHVMRRTSGLNHQVSERRMTPAQTQRRNTNNHSGSESFMEEVRAPAPSYLELVYLLQTESAKRQSTGSHQVAASHRSLQADHKKAVTVRFADSGAMSSLHPGTATTPRRSFDEETASMYSSMSAPLDHHEVVIRSQLMKLDRPISPPEPALIASLPAVPPIAVLPVSNPHSAETQRRIITPSTMTLTAATRKEAREDRRTDSYADGDLYTAFSGSLGQQAAPIHPITLSRSPPRVHWCPTIPESDHKVEAEATALSSPTPSARLSRPASVVADTRNNVTLAGQNSITSRGSRLVSARGQVLHNPNVI